MLIGLDLEQLRDTPFGQHLLATMNLYGADKWAGIDFSRDSSKALVIIGPRFGLIVAKLTPSAKPAAPSSGPFEEHRGFRTDSDPDREPSVARIIVDRSLLISGTPQSVKTALDRLLDKEPPNPQILSAASSLSEAGPVWMMSSPDDTAAVPASESLRISMKTSKEGGVEVRMELGLSNPQSARDLAEDVKLPGAKATIDGSRVTILATMPEQQAIELLLPH